VSRSTGRSAVAAAAYRVGECLYDEMLHQTYDYTRRSGIVTTFALAPDGSPDWVHDPEALWNAAERAEKRCNSQVAREYELALPASVSAEEREASPRSWFSATASRSPPQSMRLPGTATIATSTPTSSPRRGAWSRTGWARRRASLYIAKQNSRCSYLGRSKYQLCNCIPVHATCRLCGGCSAFRVRTFDKPFMKINCLDRLFGWFVFGFVKDVVAEFLDILAGAKQERVALKAS
jgi:hypothetical protein